MARSNDQTKLKPQLLKSSSFAWDKAFFTSEGVLDDDELSSMIEGDGNNVTLQLQPIQEIENVEAKLFPQTSKSNKIKTQPTRSTVNNVKSSTTMARNSTKSKTSKSKPNSPSKTPPGKLNVNLPSHLGFSNLSPRASSPGSPGSPSSKSAINQKSSSRDRSSSVPPRSLVSSSTDLRRKDEQKPAKLPNIKLKDKSPPLINSLPSSPLGISNSSSCTSLVSSLLSSHKVNKRSTSTGTRGNSSSVNSKSLNRDTSASSSLKTRPASQNPDRTIKTGQTGLKSNPQRSSSPRRTRVQSSGKERGSSSGLKGVRNIFVVSPEIMDIKGKLNALKMEMTSMQKKDKLKETKMVPAKIGKSESCSSISKNSSHQMNNQARRR